MVKKKILLITSSDDTYRKPLLEADGYEVHTAGINDARPIIGSELYNLVLIGTELAGATMQEFCQQIRRTRPGVKIGVLAQNADYVAADDCADAVIRSQHSPGRFLATVRKIVELAPGDKFGNEGDDE
jgi:DNA-binding response OmpR family regulator